VQKVPNIRRHHLIGIVSGITAAFLLTVVCYWPSLSGPFLFDDIPNLELIGERGGLTSADNYLEFILSAQSGPLGRPLSLASFTLNGQTWPTDPRPFRVMNLIIHLVNGALVFLLARLIFSTLYKRELAENLALLCMTLWLLHPLSVSTTAYVIQRMTQLGSLFTLAGLLSYMYGRTYLADRPFKAWALILAGMGVSGTLALLSKETGILLPFYALVIEVTVFNSSGIARRQKAALIGILCAPLIVLLAYMAMNWGGQLAGFELRPFTMEERLLTQGVVLVDYLHQIMVPQLSGLGVFHDDYPVSTGLFHPVSTIVSFTIIAALLSLAVWLRKTWPIVSLGILWFFVGHSLEAGPIALELYFEHRNYLALLGPILVLGSLLPLLSQELRRLLPLVLILLVGVEGFITWQAATSWGNEDRLMQITLTEHPDSLRAQQYVGNKYIMHGNYSKALAVQEGLAEEYPKHTSTRLSILNLRCLLDVLTVEQVNTTQRLLEHSGFDKQAIGFFGPLVSNAANSTCASLDFANLQVLFDTLLHNPGLAKSNTLRGAIHYHKGLAYKMTGDLEKALEQFDLSYTANPEIDIRLQQIVWSLEAGDTDLAEHYLVLAQQHGKGRILRSSYRDADLSILRQRIDQGRN